ncbi:hypothetical protein AC579_2375 [Pseudocercospora musae]|uniref:Metalloendopeptidase n=1 Tax=Pseudocercospora musae TaxID=113226 RepID=A0A139IGM2_9PEZI|nr:hypothetical protein AC579_2375 [Pseudocercospora musae]
MNIGLEPKGCFNDATKFCTHFRMARSHAKPWPHLSDGRGATVFSDMSHSRDITCKYPTSLKCQRFTVHELIKTSFSRDAILLKQHLLTTAPAHCGPYNKASAIHTMKGIVILPLSFAALLASACPPKPQLLDEHSVLAYLSNGTFWHDLDTATNSSITKRWLSVPGVPSNGANGMVNPYQYPWPLSCSEPRKSAIRYCFNNQRSANNLLPVLQRAIALWYPAMRNPQGQVSSMTIEPDSGCPRDENGQLQPDCLCASPGVSRDALIISDETKDGDNAWNDGPDCQTSTTTGYSYIGGGEPSVAWRHRLRFCAYEPSDNNRSILRAIRAMTHELGHAMGLFHEHQRPDRDNSLKFRCRYLQGWRDAREKVNSDEYGFFEALGRSGHSREEKMTLVCSSWLLAQRYLPILMDFLRTDQFDFNGAVPYQRRYGNTEYSEDFDYNTPHYIIKTRQGDPITYGGSVSNPRISEGDVARIAQLYPVDTEQNRRARTGNGQKDWSTTEDKNAKVKRTTKSKTMTIRIGNSAPLLVSAPRPPREEAEA